jgi:hypothetical protein
LYSCNPPIRKNCTLEILPSGKLYSGNPSIRKNCTLEILPWWNLIFIFHQNACLTVKQIVFKKKSNKKWVPC